MVIEHKKTDNLRAVVNIKIQPEDYKPKVDKVISDYRKQASLPGFRKGKVPVGIVKKMVGKNVLLDELNKLLSEKLNEYIRENDLQVLGNPLPKEEDVPSLDLDTQEEFDFAYELGLAPEVKFEVSSKYKFNKYKILVDDKLVDQYVNDAAKRYGKVSEADSVNETDMVHGQFVELDKKGEPKPEGIMHNSTVVLDTIEDDKLKKQFVGKKAGDVLEVNPFKLTPNPADQAAMLGVERDKLDGVSDKFKFTIERINRLEPHAIDKELFEKIYGPDAAKDEAEFRAKIKEDLEKSLEADSDRQLMKDIEDELISKLKLDLPDDFLRKWLESSENVTKEQVDKEYDQYAKGLRWQLIENHVIKQHNIEVKPEEAMDYTKGMVARQMMQYGMPIPEDDELTQTAQRVMSNEEEMRNIYQALYQDKLMQLYKENFKIKEKEISYDDFVKKAKG